MMRSIKRPVVWVLLACLLAGPGADVRSMADDTPAPAAAAEVSVFETSTDATESFTKNIRKAVGQAARDGKITRVQALRLRIAFLSPAFRARAQELAVVQIASSGSEAKEVPYTSDGKVDVANIDWEGLIQFLEALLPLILQLISALA